MKNLFWLVCLMAWVSITNISFAEDTDVLDDIPPPPVINYESGYEGEPEITIKKKDGEFIEEYRVNGQLYMMKVTPDNMPSYYLYKNTSGADWIRYNSLEFAIVPQWVILSF
ncbi:DUF2782 domain-containing protein [Methylophilaceae bacterium]|nr:DUF2782 domain-containing protein [Methylophilaceae bacterium]